MCFDSFKTLQIILSKIFVLRSEWYFLHVCAWLTFCRKKLFGQHNPELVDIALVFV